jgi:hydrogenase expression/formation protein HypC
LVSLGDESMCLAVPGKIVSIQGEEPLLRMGKVNFGSAIKEVSLAYVPEARVGDYAIVHVGFAIGIVDPDAAEQALQDFQQLQNS